MGVLLYTDGKDNSLALKQILETAYGRGMRLSGDDPEFVWYGRKATARFQQNKVTGDAEVWIGNIEMQKQYEQFHVGEVKKVAKLL